MVPYKIQFVSMKKWKIIQIIYSVLRKWKCLLTIITKVLINFSSYVVSPTRHIKIKCYKLLDRLNLITLHLFQSIPLLQVAWNRHESKTYRCLKWKPFCTHISRVLIHVFQSVYWTGYSYLPSELTKTIITPTKREIAQLNIIIGRSHLPLLLQRF